MRPLDYVWNGQRVTHYRNHAGEWMPCPATAANHHTLRSARNEPVDAIGRSTER